MTNARAFRVTSLFLLPLVAASSACGLLGIGSHDSPVEVGTVRLIAFDHRGAPARSADVVVQDAYGEVFARGKLGVDGTGEVDSIAGGTITVAIRPKKGNANITQDAGDLVTYTEVPLDVTLHVGAPDPRNNDATFDVNIVVPERAGSGAYKLTIGCDSNHGPAVQTAPEFVFHVPEGCGTRPRTIIATALAPNFSPAAISVLREVELEKGGKIEMPAFEPLRAVDIDVAIHDPSTRFYFGHVTVLDAGGTYEFLGTGDQAHGHLTSQLPWNDRVELTRYERELLYEGGDLIESIHHRIEAGAPASTAITDADFLPPPGGGEGDFGFTYDAEVDARRLDLTWNCLKCNAHGQWTLFGPSSQEPFTLPELPADLHSLSPDNGYINSIVGNIFENSDQDGYAGFLNASPDPVAGTTHRQALVVLRNEDI